MKIEGVERATAAVVVRGTRTGSCVLVDRRHALTAQHVVGRQSPAGTEVELRFPAVGARIPAVSVDIGEWAREMDITLLELTVDLSEGISVPAWLPFAGAAERLRIFGYPLGERDLKGIWVQTTPAGLAATGVLQIDAAGGTSSLRGHSGGPVVEAETGAVIGVLVEGSEELRFDRAVPIELLARHCPGLGRWWMFAGDNATDHFRGRAAGQRSIVRGWDLFRGRGAALDRIRKAAVDEDELPLVITGQPGAGKSTVLARAALAERERTATLGLAFHARGQGIGDLIRAVSRVAAAPPSSTSSELLEHLVERQPGRLVLFVDALDEMATERDIDGAVRLLRELSSIVGVSVTVATRWRAPGGDRRIRDLPSQFAAIAGGRRDSLVDLDSDRYFDGRDLLAYAEAVLCQEEALRPGPRDAAWQEYRRDPGLRHRLAEAIVRRADRNYLVAAMAALSLSESDEVVDVRRPGFDERRDLPSTVGGALDKYLDRLPDGQRQRTEHLLVALAYAEGSGLTDDRWRAFTEALGYAQPSIDDLDALRTSGAADYLLQTTAGEGERTTRLFHQSLVDHLRENRDTRNDRRRIAACLVAELPEADWSRAPHYLRQHGPMHLAAGGLLDEHLTDVRFLLTVEPERLIGVLPAATSPPARQAAHIYELAYHQLVTRSAAERPAYLQFAARCAGDESLAAALTDAVRTSPWSALWAQWRPPHAHRLLGRHRGSARAVAVSELAGEPVVVSAGYDGAVRVWRLVGGAPVGEPWSGHDGPASAVAVGELECRPVVISGGDDGTVRVWWLHSGLPVGEPWRGHSGWVRAVAVGELEGHAVVVSGGADGTVRVWRLDSGLPVGDPWRGHEGVVRAVAVADLDGRPVVVSGGDDGTVRVWRLDDGGAPLGGPWRGHDGQVLTTTVGTLEGRPTVVSGGADGTVRVWRLDDGAPVGEPWRGHEGRVSAVAVGELEGHPVVVSGGGGDGTVRIWRLSAGATIGELWHGHDWVNAVTVGQFEGRPVVISGGEDGAVRVWRLAAGAPLDEPWSGHDGHVLSVAVSQTAGEGSVVSGGLDGTVRVWRLDSGVPVGEPWRGHQGRVSAVAVGELDGRAVVASGGGDGTVRVWQLREGTPIGDPRQGDRGVTAVAVGRLRGQPVVVSGDDDGRVRIWRLDHGPAVGEPWRLHKGMIFTAAVGELEGRPVLVSGGQDGTVGVWWLDDGLPVREPWRGHEGAVRAVAVGEFEHGPTVVSGGEDGMVRIWRLDEGLLLGEPWRAHGNRVLAVAVARVEGRDLVISGGGDGTVGIWQPAGGGTPQVIDLGSAVRAVAFASPHQVVVGTGMGIAVVRLGSVRAGGKGW